MTDRQNTHAPNCWSWGPKHYECALREIERLRAEIKIWEASFEQAASGHATYAEKTEQLLAENERLRAEVERLRTDLMESNEIRAALGEENSDD